ncbi:hypothetical protein B0J11DRAFT_580460 [Dendryphion nanum]|uniref:Uncharacterized protein n=1 Tax=Dendryphion nanum TaxID=256645 RepID=A0A9P9DQ69_9PLEO|nr:hypothetical protein B0J11DRAFT_580460 [Dendryphion nanum]
MSKPSQFLGVPHTQAQSYIQILTKAQSRSTINGTPTKTLTPKDIDTLLNREFSRQPFSLEPSPSTTLSSDGRFAFSDPSKKDKDRTPSQQFFSLPQRASLLAREYQNDILNPKIGPVIAVPTSRAGSLKTGDAGGAASSFRPPEHPNADPTSYGFRLIYSEALVGMNAHYIEFAETVARENTRHRADKGVNMIYIAVPSSKITTTDIVQDIYTNPAGPQFSSSLAKAIVMAG